MCHRCYGAALHCTHCRSSPHHAADPSCPPGGSSACGSPGCVCPILTHRISSSLHWLHHARGPGERPCVCRVRHCRFRVPARAPWTCRKSRRYLSEYRARGTPPLASSSCGASQRQRCPGAAGSRAEPTKGTSQNACAARARRGAVGRRSPCSGDARCTLCRHRVGHGATPQRTGAIVSSYAAERRGVPPSPCLPPGRRATLARGSPRPFPGPGAIPSAAACILSRARLLVLLRPLILPQMR